MIKRIYIILIAVALGISAVAGAQSERFGIDKRVPWTTARITGTPEPPPPYRTARAFPRLSFKSPLLLVRNPGTGRFFVGEQAGKIFSFPNDSSCAQADLFFDLTTELHSWDKSKVKGLDAVYALAFHPQFAKNRYCYICYVLGSAKNGEKLPDGTRVSRFTVTDANPPRVEPKSEKVLITWLAGGHNGCDLQFGPDGFLYISTGDATDPNPPDGLDTGQDLSDLLSSILRIDVDREENGKAYRVPPDNPFVQTPNARPEIWSYGFRNPWRMSFDRVTGDLWVGDVGWELWEMVYRIQRGGNYGWSVMEGRQPVRPESRRGPTPILPPALDFPHTEAASITGGYVYRGRRHKDLIGCYICGDWVTRKVWATRFDGDRIVSHREIAQGSERIVAFCEDDDGELYILNHDDPGTIHELVPNPQTGADPAAFPRKLSQTGLLFSVKDHILAPGVLPFSIHAEQWADRATAERFVALPHESTIKIYDRPIAIPGGFFSGQIFFPKDGVLGKTFTLEMERGNVRSRKRLETQILHFDGALWRGYSYRWNDEQTDAELVSAAGQDRTLSVADAQAPGGKTKLTWHYPSRTECITCHNPWTGHLLAFTQAQLDRDHAYDAGPDNQLRTFEHIDIIAWASAEETKKRRDRPPTKGKLVDPHDRNADLTLRARSYLHANCAHCHQFGGGGTADMELKFDTPLEKTKTLEVRPIQGTFDIHGAHILSPGDPYRSVLFYRMAKVGRGRMPHIGSELVDEDGVRLMQEWIQQLPRQREDEALVDKLKRADKMERGNVIKQLLSSTSSALYLSRALAEGKISDPLRQEVLAAATTRPEAQIRDLFEQFLPDEQRIKRLGSIIQPEQILALKGESGRGKEVFFKTGTASCINCHRINGNGSTLGPDLSLVGKKLTRIQILESILYPSKTIDPLYVTYLVETTEGRVQTGLVASKSDSEIVLKNAEDKEVRIPTSKVALLAPKKESLMPELLLRDLTADQVADLLEFLTSLR